MGQMFILPDDVSFQNIKFREGGGKCKATGSLIGKNGSIHPTGRWLPIVTDTSESAGGGRTNRVRGIDYPTISCPLIGQKAAGDLDWPID